MRPAEQPRLLSWNRVRLVLLVADALAVAIALGVAFLGRFEVDVPGLAPVPDLNPLVPPLILVVFLGTFALFGLYTMPRAAGSGYDEYRRVVTAATFALAAVVMASYLYYQVTVSRGFLLTTWAISLLLVPLARFLVRRLVRRWAGGGRVLRQVLVVGANQQGLAIAKELAGNPVASARVLGFLDEYRPTGSRLGGWEVLGDPMQLRPVAAEVGATHAVVVESALSWESLQHVVRTMHRRGGPEVLLAPGLFDVNATPLQLAQLGSTLLLVPRPTRIVGPEAFLKRLVDILAGLPLAVLSTPLQLILWRRPGVDRVPARGRFGDPVVLVSFRGERTRRAHLSRLPWLWQVVAGRLSLVGPKPVTAVDAERDAPWADLLEALKPGFLGPWWLLDRGEPASLDEEIEVDLHYARAYTAWMDLRILAAVLHALLTHRVPPPPPAPVPEPAGR